MNSNERYMIAKKVSKMSIILNIILSIIKVTAGIISKSTAMVSDGIHSLSDVLSTAAVIIGLKVSSKPADKEHPYGHEKLEPIFTKILAAILMLTAVGIGYKGIKLIAVKNFYIPGRLALYAAVTSIIIKEWMYRYTVKAAKKIQSSALKADAWHHRSDSFSSIGTFIGILGARHGYPIFDPLASILICVLILKVAVSIYKNAINQLVDHAADDNTVEIIKNEIKRTKGVVRIDELKTRLHANKLYVDVEISVNKNVSFSEAHDIAEKVHFNIENLQENIIHCMVHVNPY
ncbi:cation diffusion facilitator family transporter [Haloimpatiens sp. FM7330]|uniref:cation diffusion facilitator family transporter n=1 Tax=Haloimpatiens sp. FM7330 TaxID=3298610 RepID=UPI003628206B